MKQTITIAAIILFAACGKPQELDTITVQSDSINPKRDESPRQSRYEFFSLENYPCNTVILTGQWRVFYAGCQTNANDATPVPLKTWYREYQWTDCVNGQPVSPGNNWYLDSNDCAVSGRSKWVRDPLITPPASDVWLSICNNGQPVNPNNDPNYSGFDSNYWELIYSNCNNGIALFWRTQ